MTVLEAGFSTSHVPVSSGSYSVTATIKYYNKTTKAYLGMADYKIRTKG